MADNTAPKKKAAKPKAVPVSRKEFEDLNTNVNTLVTAVSGLADIIAKNKPATPEDARVEKEAEKAAPNKITSNPDWEDIAREIIGEPVDHTEVEYLKGGGLKFTVVIKGEFSNAPLDYIERYKTDRRSKEVGADGEAGVRLWCEMIRNNLKLKPKSQAL